MLKLVKLSLYLLAVLMLFSSSTLWAADQSLEKIQDKGCFVLGLDDSFPPMGFRDATGAVVGFDIDLAKEVAKRLGVKLKIQPVEWSGVIFSLNRGDIDLIWNGMTIKPERAKRIDFSKPYLANTQAVAVLADSAIQHNADLVGKQVGVQLGSPSEDAIKAQFAIAKSIGEIRKYGKYPEALLDLSAHRIDAVVGDEILLRYYLSKREGQYRILQDNFGSEQYGVGFRKDDDAFRAAVDAALDAMRKDGTAAAISKKWFGDNMMLN